MNIGRAIRISRLGNSLSQQALAIRVGISASYLSLLESGRRDPSLALLRDLAEALGMSLDLLMLTAIEYRHLGQSDSDNIAMLIERLVTLVSPSREGAGL